MAWGSRHLASQSNQVNLLQILMGITFGVDVEFRSETKRPNDGVGSNSRSEILLGRFGWFLGLFAEQAFHLRCRGSEKTKVVDPQSQTLTAPRVVMELCMSTAVLCGDAGEPACSKRDCGMSPAEPRDRGRTSEGAQPESVDFRPIVNQR